MAWKYANHSYDDKKLIQNQEKMLKNQGYKTKITTKSSKGGKTYWKKQYTLWYYK